MILVFAYMVFAIIGLTLFSLLHQALAISLKNSAKKNKKISSNYLAITHFLQKYRFITSIFLLGTALLGMHQAITFYLLNYSYYWIVVFTIFTYLLLFVLPFGSILLPFFKPQKKMSYGFFLVVGGVTLLWIIALLIQTEPFVYSDAKGYEDASLLVKNIAVVLLAMNYIIQVIYLSQLHTPSEKKVFS